MSNFTTKPVGAGPRLAKRPSMTVSTGTNFRVSKAQSLRMRVADEKAEAAEAKKAKAAAVKLEKANKMAGSV